MTSQAGFAGLLDAAVAARLNAYAPYSGFAVGAAVAGPDGRVFSGCNVENASYPVGTCAEAGAIAAMVASGVHELSEILVVADGPDLIAPCGACRQRMVEFARGGALVHLARPGGVAWSCFVADLLPGHFGARHLTEADRAR